MTGILAKYSYLADWLDGRGYIELGSNEYSRSFIRILDEGGMIWEGEEEYESLEAALAEAEAEIVKWLRGGAS